MKKIIMAAAIVCVATFAQAAAVGWSMAGLTNYKGDAYDLFIIGQNGVTSIEQITALLDSGADFTSYAFANNTVANAGLATVPASSSGKSITGTGTFTAFTILFDTATPTAGTSKYAVISGATGQTQEVGASTAMVTFAAGNQATFVNNTANWSSYGAAPEPTSGILLLLGMAGLALKRKVA